MKKLISLIWCKWLDKHWYKSDRPGGWIYCRLCGVMQLGQGFIDHANH